MENAISSLQNPLVKKVVQLQEKSRERKRSGLFVVEGVREVGLAIKGGYKPQTLIHCPQILANFPGDLSPKPQRVTASVYQKIAYRGATEGLMGIFHAKDLSLDQLKFETESPLILVAEAPEKPGNIGALLRTADAAKLDAVILANPKTDWYNPNIVRSSVGTLFTNQLAAASTDEILDYLSEQGFATYAAILQDAQSYLQADYCGPTALVVGTEATGLSKAWRERSTANIIIPMEGAIDSMNVSVAAGILIFEAKRQRRSC